MTNPMINTIIVGLGTFFLAAGGNSTFGAVLLPTSQNRSVSISVAVAGTSNGVTNSVAAPDLGVFNQTEMVNGTNPRRWHVASDQTSEIGTSSLTATGQVVVVSTLYFSAAAQSDFAVAFTSTQPVAYVLEGELSWVEPFPFLASGLPPVVTLTGPAGVVYTTPAVAGNAIPLNYSTVGILPAGDYTLEAHAQEAKPAEFATGCQFYSLAFTVTP
jgi:hypothetical protein